MSSNTVEVLVKPLSDYPLQEWGFPAYASEGAACFDLRALLPDDEVAFPDPNIRIRTGLSFKIPDGYVMLIFSRSGHGFTFSTRLSNCVGVIDSDYTGEVLVKLVKDDYDPDARTQPMLRIRRGDRIAQGILIPYPKVTMKLVEDLPDTQRGSKGFGSTGS